MTSHQKTSLEYTGVPVAIEKYLYDLIEFRIADFESTCDCDKCSEMRMHKIDLNGQLVPASWVRTTINHVPELTTDNKFRFGDSASWEALGESGQILFNYLYEFLERNQHSVFSTDLFKLDGFSNEQIVIVQKIIGSAKFNMAVVAAEFIAHVQDSYDKEWKFNPDGSE